MITCAVFSLELLQTIPGVGLMPGSHRHRDHHVQLGQRRLDVLEPVQHRPDQQRVVVVEVPGQRLGQVRQLAAHLAVRQVRHRHRVGVAGHQLRQHLPRREGRHAGGDRGQLDSRVL
jgi:hypothetical protein